MLYPAFLVHDKGSAPGKLSVLIQNPVCLRDISLHVAKKREFNSDLLRERGVGRRGINADAEYSRIFEIDLA